MPFIAHRVFNWQPLKIDSSFGLNTINPGMAYSVCNSVLCKDCYHLFLDIRFDDNELIRLYKNYRGKEYVKIRERYEPGYSKRNRILQKGYSYMPEIERFIS